MGGFIEYIADFVSNTGQFLSTTKSNVAASSKNVGEALVATWKNKGLLITFQRRTLIPRATLLGNEG